MIRIIHVIFAEFLYIGGLMDYSYYKTCGHSATVAKLGISGTHFFDLSDSFFAYTTTAAVVIGVIMIVLLAAAGILAVFFAARYDWNVDIDSISFLQNLPLWAVSAGFYVILCCFTHFVGMSKQNEIATQSLIRLIASLGDKTEDAELPIVQQDNKNNGAFRRFSRDSATQPLSVMDRQIIESVRANLPKEKKHYNIVLYLSESTFAGYYPMYNDNTENVGVTPFIESKMDNTLLLKNNYTTGVRSINSLISLLTGIGGYPGYKEINSLHEYIDTPALSQILSPLGYRSALVHGGNFWFYNKMRFLENRDFDFLIDAAELKKKYPTAMSNSWGIDDRVIVKEGLEWIDRQIADKKHFMLTLVPIAPHHPYDVPADMPHYIAKPKNDYEAYLNSLMYVDELFKQLWNGLSERGVLDDTIIVFTADHGEAFNQHKGNSGHENHIYQENVRTPCMFFNAQLFKGYNQLDTVTNLSDIFPTLLEILGEDIPPMVQGESILSRNTGKYSFFACGERNVDIGMIDGHYKAVYDYINNRMSLYDLNNEMLDFTDISASESRLT
ncbi:MAG: LTA synthase family protein, partial [Spirochaetales bacterium]|nr:LTA synthase family protein [Spirochaetales bacterium]